MKYTLDTNIYVDAFHDPVERGTLARFEFAYTPMLYLTSIVAHELRTGVRTPDAGRLLTKNICAPFEKRRRLAVPSYDGWKSAAAIRAALAVQGRPTVTASFVNDIMLAVTCREHSLVLVTRNTEDFAAIQNVFPRFRFVLPYP